MSMTDRPIEVGLTQLIGINEAVGVNQFSATADLDVTRTVGSLTAAVPGEIQSFLLVSSAAGAPLEPTGWVFFFHTDPNTTTADAALELVDRQALLGQVEILAADWDSDATGASVSKFVAIPFHSVDTIFVVFRNEGAAINDAGGDDELLSINVWYRRDD